MVNRLWTVKMAQGSLYEQIVKLEYKHQVMSIAEPADLDCQHIPT